MQIYLGGYYLYCFNKQRVFKARYMAKTPQTNRKYRKHNENNVEYKGNILTAKS